MQKLIVPQHVKLGDVLEIRDMILFEFYLGLPYMYICLQIARYDI